MPKVTVMVGGSIGCAGKASVTDVATIDHGCRYVIPASDDIARFCQFNWLLAQPTKREDFGAAEGFNQRPVSVQRFTVSPAFRVPDSTRPGHGR
jgi:hypothetical protein